MDSKGLLTGKDITIRLPGNETHWEEKGKKYFARLIEPCGPASWGCEMGVENLVDKEGVTFVNDDVDR